MSDLRLHLDEDAEAHALVRALRDRAVDVTTTSESDLAVANGRGVGPLLVIPRELSRIYAVENHE